MSIPKIFPNLLPEFDDKIAEHADGSTCLALSQVSRQAHKVLNNDFFKIHFFLHYPNLKIEEKNLFLVLQENFPKSCWKIACDYFCFKKSPISKDKTKLIAYQFFKEETPSLCNLMESRLNECIPKIRDICTNNDWQNEASPFHDVYQSFIDCAAKKAFGGISLICSRKSIELYFQKITAPIEEQEKITMSDDQLSLVSRLGQQYDNETKDFPVLKEFVRTSKHGRDYSIIFFEYHQNIKSELDSAFNLYTQVNSKVGRS